MTSLSQTPRLPLQSEVGGDEESLVVVDWLGPPKPTQPPWSLMAAPTDLSPVKSKTIYNSTPLPKPDTDTKEYCGSYWLAPHHRYSLSVFNKGAGSAKGSKPCKANNGLVYVSNMT